MNVVLWICGVDFDIFWLMELKVFNIVWLIFLYVGCVVIEKNVEVFLCFDLFGLKWVVGEGFVFVELKLCYLEVNYFGVLL